MPAPRQCGATGNRTGLGSAYSCELSERPTPYLEEIHMTAATATQLKAGTWAIDPVHSSIAFSVRHLLVSKVRGHFKTFSGEVVVGEDGSPSVTAEIAIDSIDTGNEQRDAHLKSADYFDAESYPTATFASTGVREIGDKYVLDGDFTLKGITKPVSLNLEFNGTNPGMGH